MARTMTDLDRIAYAYADYCIDGLVYEQRSTVETLRRVNGGDGFAFDLPGDPGLPDNYVRVTEYYLDDADMATVAAKIDAINA